MGYKIIKPIRLIELFGGVGSQAMALENIGANFEHYKLIEFDKFAIKSYNAIHGTNFETQDITKINGSDLEIKDTNLYEYIMTYSFPCQDLSLAGKQKGMDKGSNTRSGLLWEVERLLNEVENLPQVLLMENVTQVHGKKNKDNFESWLNFLESKGYSNYWQDLNAKDYGIPQNRNRTFMVSILNTNEIYEFPKSINLQFTIRDMLELEVDKKFYLSDAQYQRLKNTTYESGKRRIQKKEYCDTLCARDYKDPKCVVVADSVEKYNRFYSQAWETLANNECEEGNTIDAYNKKVNKTGNSPTITTRPEGFKTAILVVENSKKESKEIYKIRKLTPKECWRLMGFNDIAFEKAAKINSNSQLYKQAGNSIVVDVLEKIFKQLL